MVKSNTMKSSEPNALPTPPAPPSLMAALMSGFDSIASHIFLILFPLIIDLLLWLGPHLDVAQLTNALSGLISTVPASDPTQVQAVHDTMEMLKQMGERLNLFALLRSYPVGVPSLMASRLPVDAPGGFHVAIWQVSSWVSAIGFTLVFIAVGLLIGSLYYIGVAEAAMGKRVRVDRVLSVWPWTSLQVLLLSAVLLTLVMAVSIPAVCIILTLTLGNPALGRIALLVYGGGILWIMFPLIFSPHGIFINRENGIISLRQGVRITRMTLPNTGLLFLSIFVISQGMDIVWNIPPENSWLTLIGIAGHAFVTTALLAASFIYYHDADQWMHRMLAYWAQVPPAQSKI